MPRGRKQNVMGGGQNQTGDTGGNDSGTTPKARGVRRRKGGARGSTRTQGTTGTRGTQSRARGHNMTLSQRLDRIEQLVGVK